MIKKFLKNKSKKGQLAVRLFVLAALTTFILAMVGIFILTSARVDNAVKNNTDLVFFNKRPQDGDPLLTKVPDYRDFISRPLINSADPILGKNEAPVTIAQFSDFKCRDCHKNTETIKKLVKNYPDRVKFIWKDYPETDLNSETWRAAQAARCSADQNMFWEYEKLLFTDSGFSDQVLVELARGMGLDIEAFKKCLAEHAKNRILIDNLNEADALDISGVPTIYVDDKVFSGEMKYEDLERLVK